MGSNKVSIFDIHSTMIIETDITEKNKNSVNFRTDEDNPSVRTGQNSLGVKFLSEAIIGSAVLETKINGLEAEYNLSTEIDRGVL
jgi:hypothetical protein